MYLLYYRFIVDSDVECSTSSYDEDDYDDLISSNASPDNISTTSDSFLIQGRDRCNKPCCSTDQMSQPTDPIVLKKTERLYGSGKNVRKRCFLSSWYKQFPWIHLRCSSFKVFCYYCKYAASNIQVRVGTKSDPPFSTVGFSN